MSAAERSYMRQALRLAARGRGWTSPNPVVGAVVVRDGRVVGTGYHERYGGNHAEVNALREAGEDARGSTLYVTLEPCCVSGNTPPCTEAIVRSGIARVVVPVRDPNPDVDGRGLVALREAGVEVSEGVMSDEATRLNGPYFTRRRTGLPLVTLKLALSADGRLASPKGGPRWTSGPESRRMVHAMRSESDCVMVGVGTVLLDDPLLTDRRSPEPSRQPARLILDSELRTPIESAIVRSAGEVRTWIACSDRADRDREGGLTAAGVNVWRCETDRDGVVIESALRRAPDNGVNAVLAEGGRLVASSLLERGLVGRLSLFIAPVLYGSAGTEAFSELPSSLWEAPGALTDIRWTKVGRDVLLEASVGNGT